MLEFFKFLGIFVSFVSGVLATAFETKNKKSKALNKFGKILLVCIVLGSFVSGMTEYLESRQKHREQKIAEMERSNDLERVSFILNGTERLAHRLEPLTWRAVIRYRLETNSPLWSYVERIRKENPNVSMFDLVDDLRPRRNDPSESSAWDDLMRPRVYVGVLNRDLFEQYKDRAVPVMPGVPLRLEAIDHADPEGTWKAGPNATSPPFYSRVHFEIENEKIQWLIQEFVVRNSPDSVRSSGVISPIDLWGKVVVAESPQSTFSAVDTIIFEFPSAREGVSVKMKQIESLPQFLANRSIGVIETNSIRNVLNLPVNPAQ
jgi:hypothetical protein